MVYYMIWAELLLPHAQPSPLTLKFHRFPRLTVVVVTQKRHKVLLFFSPAIQIAAEVIVWIVIRPPRIRTENHHNHSTASRGLLGTKKGKLFWFIYELRVLSTFWLFTWWLLCGCWWWRAPCSDVSPMFRVYRARTSLNLLVQIFILPLPPIFHSLWLNCVFIK